MSHLNVVEFPQTVLREPALMLRNLADSIDAGEYGSVTSCGVVIFGETLEVFGSGIDSGGCTIGMLFSAGALRLAKGLEEHGQD